MNSGMSSIYNHATVYIARRYYLIIRVGALRNLHGPSSPSDMPKEIHYIVFWFDDVIAWVISVCVHLCFIFVFCKLISIWPKTTLSLLYLLFKSLRQGNIPSHFAVLFTLARDLIVGVPNCLLPPNPRYTNPLISFSQFANFHKLLFVF